MAICKTCIELKKLLVQAQSEAKRDREVARELSLDLDRLRDIHGTDDGADSKYN